MDIQILQRELFRLLDEQFKELGFDVQHMDGGSGQIGGTMMFLLPVTEEGDTLLADLRMAEFDGENDKLRYVQMFFTIFSELGDRYEELEKIVPALNYYARLGSYGMYPPKRQFWHKYNFVIRDLDMIDGADGIAVALLDELDMIRQQNTELYELVTALASGAITYSEAVEKGVIKPPGAND
jgi:hypothetical protein